MRSATVALVVARLLFLGTAAFVLWRNSQVAVLVDISWIVNNATRIALGDIPYRDFPLAQTPGEFVVQALLIKLFGAQYEVQIFYASLCGGAATLLAYLIARRVLSGAVPSSDWLAAILALPLIPLGIYAILPNPFYDSDACLAVLGGIALLFAARDKPTAFRFAIAGAVATVPLAFKQNIGGPFLVAVIAVLALEAWAEPARRRELRWFSLGVAAAIVVGIVLLQLFVGIDAYLRGTVGFAMSGRGIDLERIHEFADPGVLLTTALVVALAVGGPRLAERTRAILAVSAILLLVVSLVPTVLGGPQLLFPPFLMAAAALCLVRATRDGPTLEGLLPLVLLGTTLGTLESQGLNGSTYGIVPLLALAIACVVRDLAHVVPRPRRLAPYAGVIVAFVLTWSGTTFTTENIRLRFIDANAPGPVARSTFPALAGLSARGRYVPDLDAILFWVRDHVPPGESLVFLPGEDPAYYALGRRPALPTVFFYFGDVATPYTPEQIVSIADDVGLRWVVVKDKLQETLAPPRASEVVSGLTRRATLVATVGSYRVFRRD